MAGVIESFKKIFERKREHVGLILISFFWSLLSALFDAKFSPASSYRQNPFDIIFGIIVGACSLQFLHNAINNIGNGFIPSLKDVKAKIYLHLIGLNIVWGFYAVLYLFLSVVVTYVIIHSSMSVLLVILLLILLLVSIFVYYIYLAYAQNFSLKGLFNPILIFSFMKVAFKETYVKLLSFLLVTLVFVVLYFLLYVILMFIGVAELVPLAQDFYLLDLLLCTVVGYFLVVTWYFAFPYSLISVYNEKIKPVLSEEYDND